MSSLAFSRLHSCLITGDWAGKLCLWDLRTEKRLRSVLLPGKVLSLDVLQNKVALATSGRQIDIFDLRMLKEDAEMASEPLQRRESSLKYQTRKIRCIPDGKGFATCSIEGRVAIDFFDPSSAAQKRKFAFKAHRKNVDGVDHVYPVHDLQFSPRWSTAQNRQSKHRHSQVTILPPDRDPSIFATGGADGAISLWDYTTKKRVKQLAAQPEAVTSISFNGAGTKLAVASSYDWNEAELEAPPAK